MFGAALKIVAVDAALKVRHHGMCLGALLRGVLNSAIMRCGEAPRHETNLAALMQDMVRHCGMWLNAPSLDVFSCRIECALSLRVLGAPLKIAAFGAALKVAALGAAF